MTITGYTHVAMEIWGMIFCLISAFCIYISRATQERGGKVLLYLHLSNALLLLADSFAWIFRGHPGNAGSVIVHASNFIVYIMGYVMLVIFTEYIVKFVGQDTKGKRVWRAGIWILAIVSVLLVILSQFNHMYYYFDEANFYHRNNWFFLSQILAMLGSLATALVLFIYRKCMNKYRLVAFLSYIVLPFTALIIQIYVYGIALLNIAITISVLWMFVLLLAEKGKKQEEQADKLIAQTEQLLEKERDLNEMQRKVMLSKIQPHFLYNSLNTIYHLCEIEPSIAQKAINDFSEYLRGNLDSLKRSRPVTFDTELEHLKNYLALEKLRFDEDLEIVYDIQETDFVLPAISVQPLVENAVKYGVGKVPNGGRVVIATRKKKSYYEIVISDNGAGFDPMEVKEDGRSHIGIENVRQRLQLMCDATLNIESVEGKEPLQQFEFLTKTPTENAV